MDYSQIEAFLGNIDAMTSDGKANGNTEYVQPALKNLGSIAIPIIREVISPASFRNADQEITDITSHGVRRVRAVANKFKYGERARGLQILRLMNAGGRMAQNRTFFRDKDKVSSGYDLNTIVFGDSANKGKYVLPVKAAAQYSDAVGIQSYVKSVDSTFHNRASEDGTLWDSAEKKNSVNLFERHFVRPGTLLLQVITLNGCVMPIEGLRHLLLSISAAGAYGGQTSIYGVNVRNHFVGMFAGKFERPVASPYEAIHASACTDLDHVSTVAEKIGDAFKMSYPVSISAADLDNEVTSMMRQVETGDIDMKQSYADTAEKVATFFDSWFAFGD